jgi:hypothetical protein
MKLHIKLLVFVCLVASLVAMSCPTPVAEASADSDQRTTAPARITCVSGSQSRVGVMVHFNAAKYDVRVRLLKRDGTGMYLTQFWRPETKDINESWYTGADPYRIPHFYNLSCGSYKVRFDFRLTNGQVYTRLTDAFELSGASTSNQWVEYWW